MKKKPFDVVPRAVFTIKRTGRNVTNEITKSVRDPDAVTSRGTIRNRPAKINPLTTSPGNKIVRPNFSAEHDIVVKVDPVLTESGDEV